MIPDGFPGLAELVSTHCPTSGFVTWTSSPAVRPPKAAEMFVVPVVNAVSCPAEEISAMAADDEAHVALSAAEEPSEYVAVAA